MTSPTKVVFHNPNADELLDKYRPMDVYYPMGDVEDLEEYSPGGYYPVQIDDVIRGRYRIVHKLGYGGYSTVWLARDQQQDRFVAIKFIAAFAFAESSETAILHRINAAESSHPGRKYVTTLLDDFGIEGPNGHHRCLVTEVAGPSLGKVRYEGGEIPVSIARKAASQAAQGLAFLHSCGIGHGDLSPNNILFDIPNFHSWSTDDVYKYFGNPLKKTIKRRDRQPLTPAAPPYAVLPPKSLPLIQLVLETNDCTIKITDFGESFLSNDPAKVLNTVIAFAAPEIIFEDSLTTKVDIWSLACLIYETLGTHPLLESFFRERDEIITEMIRTFGKLPDRWWTQWEARGEFFEEDATFKANSKDESGEPRTVDLKERLQDMRSDKDGQKELDGDAEQLEVVLGKMLRYEPEERISIEEVLSLLPF